VTDLVLRGAGIWTGDPRAPRAEALAVKGSWICALGNAREVVRSAPAGARVVDLDGGLVVPGLWDAHLHLFDWAVSRLQVSLVGCASRRELMVRLGEAVVRRPGTDALLGWGWSSSDWADPGLPDRGELDRVTGPDRPVLLLRSDLHSGLANSAALRRVGYLESPPRMEGGSVEVGPDGMPTGLVLEMALGPLRAAFPPPGPDQMVEALAEGLASLHRRGITAICDQRLKDQGEGPLCRSALARLERDGRLATRIFSNLTMGDLEGDLPVLEGPWVRSGHVKVFADGSLGSLTARMLEPYQGRPGDRGLWSTPPRELEEVFARCARRGLPVSVHAIGDEAVQVCLDLLERLPRRPPEAAPHRVEHAQTLVGSDVGRLARLGVVASMQPSHLLDDLELADSALGPRSERAYRLRGLLQAGAVLAFGSDAPVAEPAPFLGIHAAVYRQRPEHPERGPWHGAERIRVEEALAACTSGAARAAGAQGQVGRLAVGMRADLCVLDADPFVLEARSARLDQIGSRLTVVDGQVVHEG